ncbi:tRNA pseudouridine(55) synthase TruB [Uliginosibacterium sp. H1]|uniref:tRNA pseudouridine(55) synthase TruB n=1 Tax=Uliginosibacterium sp. H1 TaxID=3114757 RepID=UPI002E16F30E|nr:tRNA pseudouridine(55) synthase TruB [Uliginosibacterium sp. H1]
MGRASRRRGDAVDGVLLLDKPHGASSNAALQRARRLLNAAKAGHAGTLDPMASGLLPVLLGEATKFSQLLLDADKAYETTLSLGVTTTTGDVEGEVLSRREVMVDEDAIRSACARFVGEIEQVPPMYSALKHQGKALYEYARQGVEIERKARRVNIREIEVLEIAPGSVSLRVRCSKGTYIRTLGQDIGEALGCGAHLSALRRTAAGPLSLDTAITVDAIEAMPAEQRSGLLLPVDTLVAHFTEVRLDVAAAERFRLGQAVEAEGHAIEGETCRVYGESFLGLGQWRAGRMQPQRLVAQAQEA